MSAPAPTLNTTRSTCPYCGVGCGVLIHSQQGRVVGVEGDPQHPANFGRLCTKGSTLAQTATAEVLLHRRLLSPQRRTRRDAVAQAVSWDAALDECAERFAHTIAQHGPDSVAFYISGQLLTEDYYVFNKLAKGLVGTNNIDTNSRLCMSSAVAAYKQSLGSDAPPTCYDDVNHAHCLFIAGANTAWAHPVLFRRIEDARAANPDLKLVVVDPRRTETAAMADLHLAILPGTDVALFHGMLHAMLWEGWADADFIACHTEGFAALKDLVRELPPRDAARICGIAEADLRQAAKWFATSSATLSLYCQGLNQSSHGTAKNTALINLHLATGHIGRAGAGPFSLTGQPNAMGGREVGGMANLLSAHRDLANPTHRAEVAALWGIAQVPEKPGKTAFELFEAAARGEIRALWIACTNPAQSLPDQALVRRALLRCEFVVLQESFAHTATAVYADVLLPASTWAEKEGTVTNSERRISRVRAAVPPPGEARHDWAIAAEFGQRLQAALARHAVAVPEHPLLAYESPEAVWCEHSESTRGRDLDITGLSYAQLEAAPQCWPCPEGQAQGAERLYTAASEARFPTPSGRARFIAQPYRPVAEPRSAAYPFSLTTGRLRDQWHGMSRSATVASLFGHEATPVARMNPHDMPRRGLKEGDLVEIRSRRGAMALVLVGDARVGGSQIDVPMHWGSEWVGGTSADGQPYAGINGLTNPAACPDSRQPELKHAAVSVRKLELPWRLQAVAWLPEPAHSQALAALRALMPQAAYAVCVPVAAPQPIPGATLSAATAPGGWAHGSAAAIRPLRSAASTEPNGPVNSESNAALSPDSNTDLGVDLNGALRAPVKAAVAAGLWFQAASREPWPAAFLEAVSNALGLIGPQLLRYADERGERRLMALHLPAAPTSASGGDTATAFTQPTDAAQTAEAPATPAAGTTRATPVTPVAGVASVAPAASAPVTASASASASAANPGHASLMGLLWAGPEARAGSAQWLQSLWQDGIDVRPLARFLLRPNPEAAARAEGRMGAASSKGRQICNCLGVDEGAIRQCLAITAGPPAGRVARVKEALRCGTQCGSCMPELQRLAREVPLASHPSPSLLPEVQT